MSDNLALYVKDCGRFKPKYVTSSYIAKHCQVTNACVSNWVRREVMPVWLRPAGFIESASGKVSVWNRDVLPQIVAWHEARQAERRKVPE